ncbi:MAG: deoxyribonuclease V [Deltaproteobacteria bacterium]|nr:deoxyribonuclease V [Deltaproteobacteria bacterium]
MLVQNLHPWDVDVPRAQAIQKELSSRISLVESVQIDEIQWIGGADVAYCTESNLLFGAIVVLRFPELSVVETKWVRDRVTFPYVPGLLSFREAPVLVKAYRKLRRRPDAMIFDAQGIAHRRGFGLACHLGLLFDLPSVGCAKTRLVGDYSPVGIRRGDSSFLELEGRTVGKVVRTRTKVKPVFVSPGHRMSVQGAAELVLATTRTSRLPEPIRMADQMVNQLKRERQL